MPVNFLGEPRVSFGPHGSRSFIPGMIEAAGIDRQVWYIPENRSSRAANDEFLAECADRLSRETVAHDALIVIDRSAEVGYSMFQRRPLLKGVAEAARIPVSQIIYCAQNSRTADTDPAGARWIFGHHYALSMAQKWGPVDADDYGFANAPQRLLVLNNKLRPQRLAALWGLDQRGLTERCEITWGGVDALYDTDRVRAEIAEHLPSFTECGAHEPARRVVDISGVTGAEGVPLDLVRQTLCEFVLETDYLHWSDRFTEKVLKPVATHRPFIVFGPQGILGKLKALGFRTFGNVIDESYDTIESPDRRLSACLDAAADVLAGDPDTFRAATASACAHNQMRLRDGMARQMRVQFAEDFRRVAG